MTKRQIDKNWQKLLASGEVTHNKKKKKPIEYEKKTKDGKKVFNPRTTGLLQFGNMTHNC